MKKGKALCFPSHHLLSIPTDIYRIFILKHPLFISLSLSFPTPFLCVSFSLSLSLSWLGSAVKQINKLWQKKQAAPIQSHTHTHIHTLGTCNTRRDEREQEMRAKRERYSKRKEERLYACICICSVMHKCESMPAWMCVCVYTVRCRVNKDFFSLGECKHCHIIIHSEYPSICWFYSFCVLVSLFLVFKRQITK